MNLMVVSQNITSPGQNPEGVTQPIRACLYRIFEQQAKLYPQKIAIRYGEKNITYNELNGRSNQLARYLQSKGIKRNTIIGLCIERSIEMIIGLLATHKAGCIYVPLDPAYPLMRIKSMIDQAEPEIVLTQEKLKDKFFQTKSNLLFVDKEEKCILAEGENNFEDGVGLDDLSHIIFTSGSTGIPKGTIHTQRSLGQNGLSISKRLGLTSKDVYLNTASIAFTSSLRQIFVPLCLGASIVIANEEERHNPFALFKLMKARSVTIFDTVAAFLENVTYSLSQLNPADRRLLLENSLRLILSSGGELPSRIPQRLLGMLSDSTRLVNMYGQTETIGNILTNPVLNHSDFELDTIPLGAPIEGTEVYLLDECLEPVKNDAPGEICVGGSSLAIGYLNSPELTAKKFVPHPFSKLPGEILFRTGDRGRWLPNGTIEFLGRLDLQVKIRGFRVEPGDIERILKQNPAVREAIVALKEIENRDPRLVAYIVAQENTDLAINELRALLSKKLPDYMVPTDFVLMASIPRLPNGKIDRFSLPNPGKERPVLAQLYAAPQNNLQIFLANLWGEMLQIDDIGIRDPFFELGGTSLLAARIVNRLQSELEEEIYITSIFEAPTVEKYAILLMNNYPEAISKKIKMNADYFLNEKVEELQNLINKKDDEESANVSQNNKLNQKKKFIENQRLKRIGRRTNKV